MSQLSDAATPLKLALDKISARAVENVSDDADDCTTLEQLALHKGKAELSSFNQDTGERKKYALRVFVLTCIWVAGIYAAVMFQGFHFRGFQLGEGVMLAMIGSTTANIVGVFLIVMRYFFPKR